MSTNFLSICLLFLRKKQGKVEDLNVYYNECVPSLEMSIFKLFPLSLVSLLQAHEYEHIPFI